MQPERGGIRTWCFCLRLQGRLHRQALPDRVLAGSDHQAARPHRLHQDERRRPGRVSAQRRGGLGVPEAGPLNRAKVRAKVRATLGSKARQLLHICPPQGNHCDRVPVEVPFTLNQLLGFSQEVWIKDNGAIKSHVNVVPITCVLCLSVQSEIE